MNKLTEEKIHPTVMAFKHFVNEHPGLLKEIRKSGRSWQEHYEKWILLGEEDSHWEKYKPIKKSETKGESKEKSTEILGQLMKLSENIDINKLQGQVEQFNNSISTIQEVIAQFQQSKKTSNTAKSPMNWFRD